jgi:hypothetical protein
MRQRLRFGHAAGRAPDHEAQRGAHLQRRHAGRHLDRAPSATWVLRGFRYSTGAFGGAL